MKMQQRWRACALGLTILLTLSSALSAHEKKNFGAINLTIGWGDEPALSGLKNAVEVDVTDAAGAGLAEPVARLTVEVRFGIERVSLPLLPDGKRPGKYRAWLVPTRPGSYMFRVSGSVKDQLIDLSSTCSDATFACVTNIADVQFPVKDPAVGELADAVNRALPRADRAMEVATLARNLASGAIATAVLALGWLFKNDRRRGKRRA